MDGQQHRTAESEDEGEELFTPVRRVIPAATAPAVHTLGLRSVFELAAAPDPVARKLSAGLRSPTLSDAHDLGGQDAQYLRDLGAVRCIGGRYPSNRWTPERQAKETARRAKQRPPRPTRRAKTLGAKLARIVGEAPRHATLGPMAEDLA